MISKHFLHSKILLEDFWCFIELEQVDLFTGLIYSVIEDDLEGLKNLLIGEVSIDLHYV